MKKIGLICLAVVLTLGMAGVAFGWWSDTLEIGQNPVNTGELDVGWTITYCSPYISLYPAHADHWGDYSVSADGHTLTISMGNMYPCASVKFYPVIHNTGTIPIKITGYTVTKTGGSDALWNALELQYSVVHYYTGGNKVVTFTSPYMDIGNWEAYLDAHSINYPYPPGPYGTNYVVLAPGDYLTFGDDTQTFHVKSTAGNDTESTNVSFTVDVDFTQFNAP